MFQKIKNFFKNLFKSNPKPIPAPTPVVTQPPSQPQASEITRDQLAEAHIALCMQDIGLREPNGSNRSAELDKMNDAAGVPRGSPYCITALLYRAKQICDKFGLKMPTHIEASTQEFWTSVPAKYKKIKGIKAKKGDFGLMQSKSNPGQGHAYGLRADETTVQNTFEYNTDPNTGDRDGDGFYPRTRTQEGDSAKRYLGAVDFWQWVIDTNPGKKIEPANPSDLSDIVGSWEKNHPERKSWTQYLARAIGQEFFGSFDRAKDATRFATNYYTLTKKQKIQMWVEVIIATAYYESSWNPLTNSKDVGTSDKDTWSVGLMQMSVVDQKNYGFNFGYSFAQLQLAEPNLRLALSIMARQIEKTGLVILPNSSKSRYWAVLLDGNKYSKVDSIISMVKKLSFVK